MNFTVVYKPSAEGELIDVWIAAPDQGAVSLAANQIDGVLGHDPLSQGESRDEGRRILFIDPLAVIYKVSEDDRLVTVLNVWRASP
jgi:hypothetical protein